MEGILKANHDSGNQDEFEENENDSDLEGRLYAEIYFSNEIHENEENFDDKSVKTIQDIKNASRSSLSSSELKTNQPSKNIQNLNTSEENIRNDQLLQGLDKNLNLEKQKNVDVLVDNTPSRVCNEISSKSLNLQQKTSKSSPRNKFEAKDNNLKHNSPNLRNNSPNLKNNSPYLKNGQKPNDVSNNIKNTNESPKVNNPLAIQKSAKRKSKSDKDCESERKRRSIEYNRNEVESNSQLYPVQLHSKNSWTDDNFPTISKGAMDILFPRGWREEKEVEIEKSGAKKKNKSNIIEKEEIIEIVSSESSDTSINDTPKSQKRIKKRNKKMPVWLDISSDSDSEESIFEVPVPPKPSPPLVKVKDSDSKSSDSDDGIYDLNSMPAKKKFQPNSDSDESSEESTSSNNRRFKNITKIIENSVVDSAELGSVKNSSNVSVKSSENNSNHSNCTEDEKDDSSVEDLILNCVAAKSVSLQESRGTRRSIPLVEIEKGSGAEFSEYFEPLNDDSRPSTSKINKNANYRSSKDKTDEEYFFEPMLDKVKAFYNNSWGGENFSISTIQNKMSKNPKHWAILDDDWKPSLLRQQRYFLNKTKCNLCRQSGHVRANCPEPKKSPVCHMCGTQGHYETRCPRKICLTCGKKQYSYRKTCESCNKLSCSLCRSRGHKKETCPDLWRQYHHTTDKSEYKPPENKKEVMKPSNLLICCNCTMWGHEFFNCPKYRWTPHYPTPAYVQTYNICQQKSSRISKTIIDVINLEEPGHSSQTIEIENTVEKNSRNADNLISEDSFTSVKNSDTSRNSDTSLNNSTTSINNSNRLSRDFNLFGEKIIFDCKFKDKFIKFENAPEKFDTVHCEQIILSDVENANIKELIAGRASLQFLKCLSRNLKCDICIILTDESEVQMNIIYYVPFSNRYVFRKIITLWLQIAEKEKRGCIMREISNKKFTLLNLFRKKLEKFYKRIKSVEDCYNTLKETSTWLEENKDGTNNLEIIKKKREMIFNRNLLVSLLYKHDCGVEKGVFENLEKLLDTVNEIRVPCEKYISLYYYYHLVFAEYTPMNLVQMVNTYFTLNAKEVNVSLNQLVYENQESDKEITEKEDNPLNSSQETNLSLPQEDNLTLEPQNSEPKRKVFTFPNADFIPISSTESPQFSLDKQRGVKNFKNTLPKTPERQRNKFPSHQDLTPSSSKDYHQINLMENDVRYSKDSKKSPNRRRGNKKNKKYQQLKNEATICMNEALKINMPEITKAAIKVGELINQTQLERKHINYLQHLIKSQVKKSMKKNFKKH